MRKALKAYIGPCFLMTFLVLLNLGLAVATSYLETQYPTSMGLEVWIGFYMAVGMISVIAFLLVLCSLFSFRRTKDETSSPALVTPTKYTEET